jgi:hypothetical protein
LAPTLALNPILSNAPWSFSFRTSRRRRRAPPRVLGRIASGLSPNLSNPTIAHRVRPPLLAPGQMQPGSVRSQPKISSLSLSAGPEWPSGNKQETIRFRSNRPALLAPVRRVPDLWPPHAASIARCRAEVPWRALRGTSAARYCDWVFFPALSVPRPRSLSVGGDGKDPANTDSGEPYARLLLATILSGEGTIARQAGLLVI